MVEHIDDMPAGSIGLRASGKLSRADYQQAIEPALQAGVESGELRLLFVLTDFEGLEPGAWIEEVKTGFQAWVREHSAWKRFALVTDADWVARAMHMFAWLAPGEVMSFNLDQLQDARTWVSA